MKRILLALAFVVISVTAALFITAGDSDSSASSYEPAVATQWVEINPKRPSETRRDHVRDVNGRHSIDVYYENGNRGNLIYRGTGALEFESLVRSDDLEIKRANYAEDGKSVVSGFELRIDGSTKWRTEEASADVSVTTVYWADGKTVFGRNTHDRKAGKRVTVEHDIRGTALISTESDAKTRLVSRQLEFFPDGKIFRERLTKKDETGKDLSIDLSVYRQDGTLEGRQVWQNHQYCEMACYDSLIMDRTEIMSDDGTSVVQIVDISVATLLPVKTTDLRADGSRVEHDLKHDMNLEYGSMRVYKTTVRDANGNVVSEVEDQKNGEVFTLAKRFSSGSKFEANQLKLWNELEKSLIASQP